MKGNQKAPVIFLPSAILLYSTPLEYSEEHHGRGFGFGLVWCCFDNLENHSELTSSEVFVF